MVRQLRFLDDLRDPRWKRPKQGVLDIFFPALRGLPPQFALQIAQLPIHDANALLLNAITAAARWPTHGWACVIAAGPFSAADNLLSALKRLEVPRICCFPASALFDEPSNAMFSAFNLGRRAEDRMEQAARQLGFEVISIGHEVLQYLDLLNKSKNRK